MKRYKFLNLYLFSTPILLLASGFNCAKAECNSTTLWSRLPGNEVKVFAGFQQVFSDGFGDGFVSSYRPDHPFPPTFSTQTLPKENAGKLSPNDTSYISYYEIAKLDEWRICRLETWLPPQAGDDNFRKTALKTSKEYAERNPVLARITDGHMASRAIMYYYDLHGRIARIEEGNFSRKDKKSVIRICRLYDDKNRLVLFLNPHTSQSCGLAAPDLRDEWIRYRYDDIQGGQITFWDEWHHGDDQGKWSKKFEKFASKPGADGVGGAALAKSGKGVTTIYGSNAGKLDDNPANTVLNSFGQTTGSTYYFTKPPVPLDVLEHPELIYKYERRRQTYIDGEHFRLYELFKPNEHISHHRYYYQGGMLRNEQVDAKGRVTRVITVNDYRQPRPGPHPDVDDKLLTDKGLRIFGHQIYHRVYDLDPKGNPTLVAVSWNRKLRLNPLKKTHIDFAEVVYGTPDGKVKWNKLADFEKAFGFTSNAAEVFPDRSENPADDDDD
jgi:hypothetical protein